MGRYDKGNTGRRAAKRNLRRFLIVSEDSKSSLDYLKAFPHNKYLVQIDTIGGAGDALQVVERGILLRMNALKRGEPFEHIYCVFDHDGNVTRYQEAVSKTRDINDLTAIWSNECFEIWYLLHYAYRHTAIGRKDLLKEVARLLKGQYEKNDPSIYGRLRDKLDSAIKNSRRLLEAQSQISETPWMENPGTNVHELVSKLQELKDAFDS